MIINNTTIANEMRKAYKRIGVWQTDDVEVKIANTIKYLNQNDTIDLVIGDKRVTGYRVDIASKDVDEVIVTRDKIECLYSKMSILNMIVGDTISYVMETYDYYMPVNADVESISENRSYSLVELDEINEKFIPLLGV